MKDNNMEKLTEDYNHKEKLKEPMLNNLQKRRWKYLLYNRIEVKELFCMVKDSWE